MARKLAVRLYWMWRKRSDYEQWKKFGSYVGQPGHDRRQKLYLSSNELGEGHLALPHDLATAEERRR